MPDIKQSLGEYVESWNTGNYKSLDELNAKFPELKGYDTKVLGEYVESWNTGNYGSLDDLNVKFPEFFGQQPTGQPEVKKKSTPVGSSGGEFLSNKYVNKSPELLPQAAVDYESIPKPFNTKSADGTIKDVEKYLGVDIKSKLTKEQLDQVRRGEKPTITKKVSPAAGSYLSTAINNDRKAEAIKKVDSPTEGELSYNVYTSNGGTLDFDTWKVYEKDRLSKVDFVQNEIKVKSAPLTVDELPEGISTPSSLAIQQLNNLSKSSGNNFDQINNDIGGYVASYLEDLNKKDPQVYDSYKALIENTPESGFRMVPDTDNLSVKPIDRKTGLPVDGTKLYAVNEKMSHGQLGAMRDLKIGIQSKMVTDMSVTYGKMSEINNKYKHLEVTQKINEGLKTEIATYEQIISNANSEYATEEDKQYAASIQGAYERAVNQFNANNQKLSSAVSPEDTAKIAELKSQYVDLQKKYMSTGRYFEAFDKEYQRIQNKSGELQTHDGIVDGIGDAVSGIYNSFVEGKLGGLSSTAYRTALAIPSMLGSNWANTQMALLDLNTKNKDLSYVAPAGFLPGVRLVKYGDMTDAQKETFGKYNPGVDVNKLKESDFVKAEVDEVNYFNLGVTAVSEVITMYSIYNKGAQLISGLTGMGMNTSSTIATSLSSFDDYYSQALNTELSEAERYGFASVMSLFEGVTNQIMPDYKIFEGLDATTVKGLVQTFQRGGHKALTESLVNFGVMLLKETSEEASMVFIEKLNQAVVNTMKDKQVFKEVDVKEGLIEATILTAATMGLARSPAGLSSLNEVFNTENVDATKIMHLADDLNFAELPKVIQELIEGNKISAERGTQIMDIVTGVRGIKSKLPESLRSNYRAIQLLGQRESLVAQLQPTTKGDFIDINQDVKAQISEVEKQLKGLMALSKYESENVKDVTYSESINPDNGKKVYSKIQDGETTIMSRKDFLADIKELRSFGSKITNKGGTVLVENVNGKLNIYNEKTTEEFTNWYQGYKSETKGKREFDFKTNDEKQTFIADFNKRVNKVIVEMAKPILDTLNSEINSGKISASNITMVGDSLLSSGHLGQSQGVTYDSNRQTFVGLDSKGLPNDQQIPLSRIKGSTDWINPLTFTRDTIIHELAAHPYVTSLTEEAGHSDGTTIDFSNPEEAFQELMSAETDKLNPQAQVLRKGFELIKGTKYETAVRNSSYQGEFGILEEALVTAIGDRGAQLVGKEKSKFQEFLDDVLKWLNNTLFKNRGITKEEFENMTLRQYLDGINADLFQQGENVVSSKKTGKFSLKTVTNKLGAIFDNNPTEFEKLKTKSIFAYEQQQTKENSFNKPVMEGRSIAEAAEVYAGVLDLTRGFPEEPTRETDDRLREYAKENGIYFPSSEQFQYGEPKRGEESVVFLQEDGQSVVKLTTPALSKNWYNLFNRNLAHSLLFPHLSYSFIGFTERTGGKLAAVFSQRAVPVNESTPDQRLKWASTHGFIAIDDVTFDNPKLGIMLTDLHSKNVLSDGDIMNFIDPMIDILDDKKFFTSIISDIYKDNEAEGITDIVNLVDNTSDAVNEGVIEGVNDGVTEGANFQIVGQKAQLTNEIRDHLDLATKLERDLNLGQGYWDNPTPGELSAMKDIRLRTGWERGKDGYWRYEISDVEISKKYSNIDDIPMGTVSTLNSFLGTAPLLQEYPELQNFKLIRTENESSYQLGTDYFKVDGDSVEEIRAALIHEMQHYVQYKEGYALGGNEDSLMDKYISDYNTARDIYENDPSESNAEKLRRFETEYPDGVTERQARDYYIRLSGEVEARNAEWRLNLTPEERVHRLLYETEQSPRDKQVLKFPEGNRMLPQRVGVDISRRMIEGGKSFTESYDELLDEAYEVTGFTPTFRGLQMVEGDVREEIKSPMTRSSVKFSITSSLEGEALTKIKQQLIKEGYSVDDIATISVYRPTGSITAPMFSTGLDTYNSFLLPLFIDRAEVVNFLGRAGVEMDIPFAPKFQITSSLPQDEIKDIIAQGLGAMYSPELIRNQLIKLYGIKTKAGVNELDSLFETVYNNSQGKGLDLKKRRSALRSFKTSEQAYDFYVAETLDDMVNQWRGMDAVDKSLVKDGMLAKGEVGVMIQRILELEEIGETDTPEYNELLTKIKETGTEYGKALNMFKLLHENTVDKVEQLDKLAKKYGRTLPNGTKEKFKKLFDESKKLKSDISISTGVLPIQDIVEMKKKLEEIDTQIEILYRKFNPASTSLIELFGSLKGNLFKVATLFANGVINTTNAVVNATIMSPYIAKMTFTNGTAYLSVRDITTGIVKSIPITMKNIKSSYTRGAYTNAAGDAIGGKDSKTFLRYFQPLTEVIGATYDRIFTDLSTEDIATNRNFLLKDGKISSKDIMTKLVSGTIGANSDFMLRSLVTGDVPFSNASYFQHLRRLGRSEGLDSRGLKAFVDNPPNWAHDLAVQDSRISTYTQENPVTKGLSSAKRYFKNNATSAKSSGARALGGFSYIASEIIMPFTHVPMNFIWHIVKIANPNLYLVEGSSHAFTLKDINAKLKEERAKDRPNEDTIKHLSKQRTSTIDKISKAAYMTAASHTVLWFFKMGAQSGAFYGSGDDKERKEIRKNNRDRGRVNSMNVSKFLRYLNRDTSKPWNPEGENVGDYKMRLDKIATVGLLPIIIANNAEKEKFENRKKGIVETTGDDLGNTFNQLFSLSENFSSTLSESLQQTFLQTVSKISDVVRNGDERNFSVIIGDVLNTLTTYTLVPNNVVAVEQASRDYIPSSNRSLGEDNEFGTMDRIAALAKAKLNIKGSTITDGFGRDIPQTPEDYWMGDSFLARLYYHSVSITKVEKIGDKSQLEDGEKIFMALDDYLTNNTAKGIFTEDFPTKLKDRNGVTQTMNVDEIDRYKREMGALRLGLVNKVFTNPEFKALLTLNHPYTKGDLDRLNEINLMEVKTPADIEEKKKLVGKLSDLTKIDIMDKDGNLLGEWEKYYDLGKITGSTYNSLAQDATRTVIKDSFGKTLKEIEDTYNNYFLYNVMKPSEEIPSNLITADEEKAYRDPKTAKEFAYGVETIKKTLNVKF